jgi:ferredoxin
VSFVPGLGIVKGMALTLRRFFEPKATIRYPEEPAALSAKFRGRLQLLYDEYGTLKCETCFQCAQACPVECIDMGGIDTKARFHVHWGAAETYGERREESALRRSGRTVPDPAYTHFEADDLRPVDDILQEHDFDPGRMLQILEATQQRYGYLPVGALKRIAHRTGAWYAMIYGTASYYRHLRFEPAESAPQAAALAARRPTEATYLAAFEASLAGSAGGRAAGKAEGRAAARPGRGKTAANADGGKATRDKRDADTAARPERRRGRTQA